MGGWIEPGAGHGLLRLPHRDGDSPGRPGQSPEGSSRPGRPGSQPGIRPGRGNRPGHHRVDAMSVTFAKGFRAAGAAAGIKPSGALDLSVVIAEEPAPAAAVFTRNGAAAAPVRLSRRHMEISQGTIRGVTLNSGCANAATGEVGDRAAYDMAAAVAGALGCEVTEVLVCSTGPIGPQLPMDKILPAMQLLVARAEPSPSAGRQAAAGLMTTDTFIKEAAVSGLGGFRVGGMAKGAAMIRPSMATMLAVVTTDAVSSVQRLKGVLSEAVEDTFNTINIDGCESTNDTVILMASGRSGIEPSPEELTKGVRTVCAQLARDIVADAEDCTRVVTIRVSGAADDGSARRMGMAIADSDLVRCSFYGGDPNWGRLVAALGACGEPLDASRIDITYQGTAVARGGIHTGVDLSAVEPLLAGDFAVDVAVGDGPGTARILTSDLTPGYVTFNAEPS
ncbi:MAG: bifunctional glutamate N-acetyltransferase/amino-acid acetyltransferase ArgJ [Acidimicrobiia bacterium]|nr:bifunctional glutamate N-acetyltransferase/amino-acid acetyltransferase ArgJ [Acidimicrobiia bacterium]